MDAQRGPAAAAGRGRGAQAIEALIEQRIAASVATVFSYLVDPSKFVQWMGVSAQIDPRPGGAFRLDVDGEHIAVGQYQVVEPPHRIVLSWGWEGDADVAPGSTTVEITLTPDGTGTMLRLRHSGFPTDEQRDSHQKGWVAYTGKLAALMR